MIDIPISNPTEDDMVAGLEIAHGTPGCYLKTQGDCNFAARLAERERQLKSSLAEIERLREEWQYNKTMFDRVFDERQLFRIELIDRKQAMAELISSYVREEKSDITSCPENGQ